MQSRQPERISGVGGHSEKHADVQCGISGMGAESPLHSILSLLTVRFINMYKYFDILAVMSDVSTSGKPHILQQITDLPNA